MLFNPERIGLGKVMRDREEQVLRLLWKGEATTGDLVEATGFRREAVLRILVRFVELGVVSCRDDYTMGPLRDVWSVKVDEKGFKMMVSRRMLSSLLDDWPEEAADEFVEELKTRPELLERVKEKLEE